MFKHNFLDFDNLSARLTDTGRYYKTPEGIEYPSVTTVLGRASDNTWLEEWRKRVGKEKADGISRQAMAKGTALHNLCESFLLNDPEFELKKRKVMPTTLMAFSGVRKVLEQYITTIYGVECSLYSHDLKTAGRADCLCKFGGENVVLDFKTTKSMEPKKESDIQNYFYQSTCYALMTEQLTGVKFPGIVILLTNSHDKPQLFVREKAKYIAKTKEIFYEQARIEENSKI